MRTVRFEKLGLQTGDRVLDLGCGEGRHILQLHDYADVNCVGVDLGFDDIQIARDRFHEWTGKSCPNGADRWTILNGDALSLPFADESFDVIVCSEVLEHIPDYETALDEIERILKPGGTLAASVPRYGPERLCWALSEEYHNEPGGHVRIFKARALKADIESHHMTCFGHHWEHGLHSPFWWLKCLMWEKRDTAWIINLYHRFLIWDLMKKPLLTRSLDFVLNPLIGKSVVFYFHKEPHPDSLA